MAAEPKDVSGVESVKVVRVLFGSPAVALIERNISEFRANVYAMAARNAQKRLAILGQDSGPILEEDAEEAWGDAFDQ